MAWDLGEIVFHFRRNKETYNLVWRNNVFLREGKRRRETFPFYERVLDLGRKKERNCLFGEIAEEYERVKELEKLF